MSQTKKKDILVITSPEEDDRPPLELVRYGNEGQIISGNLYKNIDLDFLEEVLERVKEKNYTHVKRYSKRYFLSMLIITVVLYLIFALFDGFSDNALYTLPATACGHILGLLFISRLISGMFFLRTVLVKYMNFAIVFMSVTFCKEELSFYFDHLFNADLFFYFIMMAVYSYFSYNFVLKTFTSNKVYKKVKYIYMFLLFFYLFNSIDENLHEIPYGSYHSNISTPLFSYDKKDGDIDGFLALVDETNSEIVKRFEEREAELYNKKNIKKNKRKKHVYIEPEKITFE